MRHARAASTTSSSTWSLIEAFERSSEADRALIQGPADLATDAVLAANKLSALFSKGGGPGASFRFTVRVACDDDLDADGPITMTIKSRSVDVVIHQVPALITRLGEVERSATLLMLVCRAYVACCSTYQWPMPHPAEAMFADALALDRSDLRKAARRLWN